MCLVIEDSATQFLSNVVTSAFPGISVHSTPSVKQAQSWLHERSTNVKSKPLYLALVDLSLSDGAGSGLDVIRSLKEKEPHAQSVVVTIYEEDKYLFEALSAGAVGYLLKKDDPSFLSDILKRICNNEPPLSPSIANRLIEYFREPEKDSTIKTELTIRERETLAHLARGLTVAEAAGRMGLSAQTVAGYVKVIYQKLHVSNRAEATREAIRRGLV
ncbi:DNA-binding response regulator [Bdellovibrio sp. qaytius]|nr:DNA-binding response regulator [Bdellovibrio sp. qaytius]